MAVQWVLNDKGTEFLHVNKLRPGKTARKRKNRLAREKAK